MVTKISLGKIKTTIKGWKLGDYFRQFSIVAAGIIVTFWGSDRITENARQKEVRATMQLVADELEYNKGELLETEYLLKQDMHMSLLLKEHKMSVAEIPQDTLDKYQGLFGNLYDFSYRTDALDVLKGSSMMQYIPDKRLLQDILQAYYQLGGVQKSVNDYYSLKKSVLVSVNMLQSREEVLAGNSGSIYHLLENDKFINFVDLTPNFFVWREFISLNEILDKQIQALRARYK